LSGFPRKSGVQGFRIKGPDQSIDQAFPCVACCFYLRSFRRPQKAQNAQEMNLKNSNIIRIVKRSLQLHQQTWDETHPFTFFKQLLYRRQLLIWSAFSHQTADDNACISFRFRTSRYHFCQGWEWAPSYQIFFLKISYKTVYQIVTK